MSIYSEICEQAVSLEASVGRKATSLYLGRKEFKRLGEWLYEQGYITTPELENKEGDHRPEVNGLIVYEVNDESHMACS